MQGDRAAAEPPTAERPQHAMQRDLGRSEEPQLGREQATDGGAVVLAKEARAPAVQARLAIRRHAGGAGGTVMDDRGGGLVPDLPTGLAQRVTEVHLLAVRDIALVKAADLAER